MKEGIAEVTVGGMLLSSMFWIDALHAVSVVAGAIAAICGAVIGIAGVVRLMKKSNI
jgi:hypothetical protein